jgi:hypothetical protein
MDGIDGGTVAGIGISALLVAAWQRIIGAPDKISSLEQRMKSVEERIDAPLTGLVAVITQLRDAVEHMNQTLMKISRTSGIGE